MKPFLFSLIVLLGLSFVRAQESSVQESTFKVYGNCSMCKNRIEKAVTIKGVRYAKWNKSTKMLKVAFMSEAVTVDSLQKRIAAVGHDTDAYKAPDAVYEVLPECCLYRDNAVTH